VSDAILREIRDLVQQDVNRRGLATDPDANLFNACPDDFTAACHSIAETPDAGLCVVTGFYILDADPPAGETDGPLGALFLARALTPLGIHAAVATDVFCRRAIEVGLGAAGLSSSVPIIDLANADSLPGTHLVALERVGPGCDGRCYNMRGRDISAQMSPAHLFFEDAYGPRFVATVGIGDGGNEIGMGKVPWDVIRRNVPNGALIACRVPTDRLIVAGVSNWGAYALAAGVLLLRGAMPDPSLFDVERERELLRIMVENGPLVDGVTGKPTLSVDGLPFEEYVKPLRRLKDLLGW